MQPEASDSSGRPNDFRSHPENFSQNNILDEWQPVLENHSTMGLLRGRPSHEAPGVWGCPSTCWGAFRGEGGGAPAVPPEPDC